MANWGGIPVARQDGSQSSHSLEPLGPVVGVGRESCGASCLQAARSQGCRTPARSSKTLDPGALCYAMLCYAKSLQSCPTLCDPIDGSPPGSPVPGILQARTLE